MAYDRVGWTRLGHVLLPYKEVCGMPFLQHFGVHRYMAAINNLILFFRCNQC